MLSTRDSDGLVAILVEQFKNAFWWPADHGASAMDKNRTLDQAWVRMHRGNQRVVVQG